MPALPRHPEVDWGKLQIKEDPDIWFTLGVPLGSPVYAHPRIMPEVDAWFRKVRKLIAEALEAK